MKKLMIVAAVAAMTGVALADAQVYEYKLTLKSTTCKSGKVTKNTYLTEVVGYSAGDQFEYRTSASYSYAGLVWGCDCARTFADAGVGSTKWWADDLASDGTTVVWDGLTFWETKSQAFLGGVYDGTEMATAVFNRMGKKADEIEIAFSLYPSTTSTTLFLLECAGQGSIKDASLGTGTDCNGSYIKSAKGNVAGFLDADDLASGGCFYCGTVSCLVYDFCDCLGLSNQALTVAYGTWTMKYNATASKKLMTSAKITSSYNFPKSVKDALVAAKE